MVDLDGIVQPNMRFPGGFAHEWQEVTSNSNAVAVDASKGDLIYHELTENTTIGKPSNLRDGQLLYFLFLNTTDNRTVSWNAAFKTNAGLTITTGAKYSLVSFRYHASDDLLFEETRSLNMG